MLFNTGCFSLFSCINLCHSGLNMRKKVLVIDCQNLNFSRELSRDRLSRAQELLGVDVLRRFMCFALYLLGVNRRAISEEVNMPADTAKSVLKALGKDGLGALEDRRRNCSSFLPAPHPQVAPMSLREEKKRLIIELGRSGKALEIPRSNGLQIRTILLTLLQNGLLAKKKVAEALNLTAAYTADLAQRLEQEDVFCLLDKREGQKSDYRVGPDVKGELIQQFVADLIGRGQASGVGVAAELRERCNLNLPARTVRFHLARLGLPGIKKSLPKLVETVKKTSRSGAGDEG